MNFYSLRKKYFTGTDFFYFFGCLSLKKTALTWIVPGGSFDRVLDEETGQTTVVPDSFQYTEKTPVGPFDMFVALPNAYR